MPSFIDELTKIAEAAKVEAAQSAAVPHVDALEQKLKPGDVLFTAPIRSRMKSRFGKYVFKPISKLVQRTDYGHSSIYVGKGQVVEARIGEGTRTRTLNAVARKNNIVAFRPKVTREERKAAVRYALSSEGTPYSKAKLLLAAMPFRGRREGRKPEEAKAHICSALVANAYPRRKFSLAARQSTRPSEIMQAPVMKPVTALEAKS